MSLLGRRHDENRPGTYSRLTLDLWSPRLRETCFPLPPSIKEEEGDNRERPAWHLLFLDGRGVAEGDGAGGDGGRDGRRMGLSPPRQTHAILTKLFEPVNNPPCIRPQAGRSDVSAPRSRL